MVATKLTLAVLLLGVSLAAADIYLQMPRGSNNRLDEANRARNNGDRLFDSQNNNRGGYNVGAVYYYAGSEMNIEWTNQHSCGNPNNNCEVVIQFMCDNLLRDGTTTNRIDDTKAADTNVRFGRHESWQWYQDCKWRSRNRGLFTANQNMANRNAAIHTRQNNNGNRDGFECPEERDYYPYWHPSPWRDIAVFTNQAKRCAAYQAESQNVKSKYMCVPPQDWIDYQLSRGRQGFIPINQTECEAIRSITIRDPVTNETVAAKWTEVKPWGLPAPVCTEARWARDNHLGNVEGGDPAAFNWTIPAMPHERCVLRVRYNISTGEYNDWENEFSVQSSTVVNASRSFITNDQSKDPALVDVWSKYNLAYTDVDESFDRNNNNRGDANLKNSRDYVLKDNPRVDIFGDLIDRVDATAPRMVRLQLAINTNQFGRTFEDRSHRFAIRSVPEDLQKELDKEGNRIVNLQVRGKRGNIVQTFPGTEYDFFPQRLEIRNGDYIHFQWTGSNTNPDNNAGQGKAGTDRHNAVLLAGPNYYEGQVPTTPPTYGQWGNNRPARIDNASMPFLGLSREDRQRLAILNNMQFGGEMSELDDAGTYFDLGPRKVTRNGIYHYLCTRNNNFSNRDQRGRITVSDSRLKAALMGTSASSIDAGTARLTAAAGQLSQLVHISVLSTSRSADSSISGDVASEYIEVQPRLLPLNPGQALKLEITYDSNPIGSASMYRSDSMFGSWSSQKDSEFESGTATTKITQGGVYVVQAPTNWLAVGGVTFGVLLVIFGCVFYGYRRYRMPSTAGMEKASGV